MKRLHILLIISTLFFISGSVFAQDYTVTGVSATGEGTSQGTVDTEMVSLDLTSGETTNTEETSPAHDSDGDPDEPVIVAPVPNSGEGGIEHEDIGVTDPASAPVPGVEPDEIDLKSDSDEETASGYMKMGDIKGEATDANMSVEREMKESGEKGGTEDINIGVGENTQADDGHKDWIIIESMSSPIQREDLVDEIQKSAGDGLRAIYLKNEDATEAKKPKEIVVVGSKVRDEDVPQVRFGDNETGAAMADSFFDIDPGTGSFKDAELHAVSVAQNDENIEEISLTFDTIRMEYDSKLKLFGFIPVPIRQTIEVNTQNGEELGRVKVRMPWWHVLGRKIVGQGDLQRALDEVLPQTSETDDRPTEEVAFNYNKISAAMLQTVSNVMKAAHNTAENTL